MNANHSSIGPLPQKSLAVWIPRVRNITRDCFEKLTGPRKPHPDFFDFSILLLGRAMEVTYQVGALQCCLALSRIELMVKGSVYEAMVWEQFRAEMGEAREEFAIAWEDEIAQRAVPKPARETPAPAPALASIAPPPTVPGGGAEDAAEALREKAPAPAETRGNTALEPQPPSTPSSGFDGTFAYVAEKMARGDSDLLETYLGEAAERLESIEQALLSLEMEPGDAENITRLFRALHTIKGNAGFLGLEEIMKLTHAMEHFLEPVRRNAVTLDAEAMDLLFHGVDVVAQLHRNLRARLTQPEGGAEPLNAIPWLPVTDRFQRRPLAA